MARIYQQWATFSVSTDRNELLAVFKEAQYQNTSCVDLSRLPFSQAISTTPTIMEYGFIN